MIKIPGYAKPPSYFARNISLSPAGNIEATNVQDAAEELDSELIGVLSEKVSSGSPIFNSPALFPDGSESVPSITNINDENTGIYFPNSDTLSMSTGGVERFKVNNVGLIRKNNYSYELSGGKSIVTNNTAQDLFSLTVSDRTAFSATFDIFVSNENIGYATTSQKWFAGYRGYFSSNNIVFNKINGIDTGSNTGSFIDIPEGTLSASITGTGNTENRIITFKYTNPAQTGSSGSQNAFISYTAEITGRLDTINASLPTLQFL